MKIGILTFHSQINYGGVLQAYALQTALQQLGYDVIIIDRWLDEKNQSLKGVFTFRWGEWRKVILRSVMGCGDLALIERHWRTIQFIKKRLVLSPYHFYHWHEAPNRLGVDRLIVGSDQIWHGGNWGNPLPYLLEGMVEKLPAITYAASFGMTQLPESLIDAYRKGFKRFQAISVREAEGVKLVAEHGATATHVLDPTLLLEPQTWRQVIPTRKQRKPTLLCYFLSEDLQAAIPFLEKFAKETNCNVRILTASPVLTASPRSFKQFLNHLSTWFVGKMSNIRVLNGAGPQEFLNSFASATWILSDSFHAVMFSAIFERNVRVLRPHNEDRQAMFARIEEFAQSAVITGQLISDNVPCALKSLKEDAPLRFNDHFICKRRAESLAWLKRALE